MGGPRGAVAVISESSEQGGASVARGTPNAASDLDLHVICVFRTDLPQPELRRAWTRTGRPGIASARTCARSRSTSETLPE